MNNNKKKVKIGIERVDGNTYLSFEVHPSITKVFKDKAESTKTSTKWKGLKFYYIPTLTESRDYKELLSRYSLFDDYGSTLYQNNSFNVAFLRTIKSKGKILVNDDIPFAVVSQGMQNIVSFLKKYYEDYLKDYAVKGIITFEV
jgi:hypothetical protein